MPRNHRHSISRFVRLADSEGNNGATISGDEIFASGFKFARPISSGGQLSQVNSRILTR